MTFHRGAIGRERREYRQRPHRCKSRVAGWTPSVHRRRAEAVDFERRHESRAIAPRIADIRDHRGDFIVVERRAEWRHAIRARIARGARRETAVEHHAY